MMLLPGKNRRNFASFYLIVLLVTFTALHVPGAHAANKLANRTFTFTATNDSPDAAKGFYLYLPNIKKAQVDILASSAPTLANLRINENNGLGKAGITVFFENSAKGVAKDAKESFDLALKNVPATLFVGTSGFRNRGDDTGTPVGSETFKPGFTVKGDPIFSLINNSDVPQTFTVENLQFLVNVPQLADDFLPLDFSNSYGFSAYDGSATPFDVNSFDAESRGFDLPAVDAGNWVYARGRIIQGGVEVGEFVYGASYAAAVPEPNSLAMLFAGLGLLGLIARHRKQQPA